MTSLVQTPRRQEIEAAATDLFRHYGYPATTMRQLAGVLGMEAASLYSHFASKEEILRGICFRMANSFFVELEALEAAETTATEKLARFVKAHVRVLTSNGPAAAVFQHEWRHLSDEPRQRFLALRDQYESRLRDLLRLGRETGEFAIEDEKFAALTILAALNWLPNWYRPEGELSPEAIGNQLANNLLSGISKHKK